MKNINIYELPEEEKDRSFQIYEVQGKWIKDKKYLHEPNRPHRHNYYEICVFITGAGKHEIDFKSFLLIPACSMACCTTGTIFCW